MTVSIDNFIKTIYKQSKLTGGDTRLSTIAGLLDITNAAATDMARKLAAKKLINYVKYKPVTLTAAGKKLAINVIRKHRLWESFLHKTLDLSLHEIHREAEELEHLTSDFLADRIEKYLGYPATDPHGDPIPALNGNIVTDESQIVLTLAEEGYMYEISRLFSSDKDFFDFCTSNQLIIGSKLWIEKQYHGSRMTEVNINQNKILLNEDFSRMIYVKPTMKQ